MAAENEQLQVPKLKLGNQGLEVSKLGFGCMGLTGVYNAAIPEMDGISIIQDAFKKGITFLIQQMRMEPLQTKSLLVRHLKSCQEKRFS
ncbi:putative aldo-keto reductase 1 [Bienertia sinuspersici]